MSAIADWSVDELERRAGALVREALANWPPNVRQAHWEDMRQTAVCAFLEHADKPTSYAYQVAESCLKNYKWVHVRMLNGGWKSLHCREMGYEVFNPTDDPEQPNTAVDTLLSRLWEVIPRPVEWAVQRREEPDRMSTAELQREVLYILAGMSNTNLYPAEIYKASSIIAMLLDSYTWEDVQAHHRMDYYEVWDIWWHYRKTRIRPFIEMSMLHRETVRQLGRGRLTYFDEMSECELNRPQRKMVVFPDGIFTITYKHRSSYLGRPPVLEGSVQKGRRINGRPVVRAVSLGPVGEITKERLLEAVVRLEEKFERLGHEARVPHD